MKNYRPFSNLPGLPDSVRSIWRRTYALWGPDPISLLPLDTLEQLRAHILSAHETFGQPVPSEVEIDLFVRNAIEKAKGVDRLVELIASGHIAESIEVRPLKIELDILNKCNLRCPMCMMSHPSHYRRPLDRMSLETFERLADEIFWHVQALSFTFGAEPLLHPQFAEFVEIASRYRIPHLYTVTNGILLTDDIARAIVTHGMDVLAVSIDAVRPETYEKIRIGGDWNRLMRNLNSLQNIKRQLGSQKPHLELTFVMMKSNIQELPEFVEMAARLGANSVNATHMVPFWELEMKQESCSLITADTNEMLERAREKALQLGVHFSGPPLFGAGHDDYAGAQWADRFSLPVGESIRKAGHCPFPWNFAAIDMLGEVIPCGWWNNQPCMGSIRSESFLTIWNNENYRNLRAEHESGELREACRDCPAAGIGCVDREDAFLER